MSFVAALATAPQSHHPQLIDLDWTVLVQLGFFLLSVLVLYLLLWRPYLRIRAERVTRVEGTRELAARTEAEAAARLERAEAQLAEARRVGAGERAAARGQATAREQQLMAQAQAEAQKTLAEAQTRLEATLKTERVKLQAHASEIAREAARRILGREVSA